MGVVYTLPDKCRRCYHCVRECPVKAIRVKEGQAEVVDDLCISCGTCMRVCHQKAKDYRDDVADTWSLLASNEPVTALVAPSFVAAFEDVHPGQILAGIRKLGFDRVVEVAYGAELVAEEYARFMREVTDESDAGPSEDVKPPYIASPCPALVTLIEMHYPNLIPHLVPIVSPMVAIARYLRAQAREAGEESPNLVFIGPCVTKKAETVDLQEKGLELALTFKELKEMFLARNIYLEELEQTECDPPHPRLARIFPVSGGLLKSAAIDADVVESDVLVAEGNDVVEVIETLESDQVDYRFLDMLFCEGCIDGPAMDTEQSLMQRRKKVVDYTRDRVRQLGNPAEAPPRPKDLNLRRDYSVRGYTMPLPPKEELLRILEQMGKAGPEDELNCSACGYPTCREKAVAVYRGLAEPEMCLPTMVDQLEDALQELETSYHRLYETHDKLQATQEELVHAEKLSSLGQLSAGVAHELNNPLGGILLYSNLIREENVPEEVEDYVRTIGQEAARCRDIVSGLLNFARQSRVQLEPTDINAFIREVYEDFTREVSSGINVELDLDDDLREEAEIDAGQLRRVLLNLLRNALEAVGDEGEIRLSTVYQEGSNELQIVVSDDGVGISEENMSKLFTPFFTTKEQGTGLGMPIAYGIVKMHRGQIAVDSEEGDGTKVTITLPMEGRPQQATQLLGESQSGSAGSALRFI